jgi:hypothetical protein
MKLVFRPSTPRDQPAIAEFLRRTFGSEADEPYSHPEHMRWKYWQPRHGWPGSRGFLLKRDGELIAHGAAWPLRILAPGHAMSAFHLIDWAADPKLPGAGVSIMKHMAELVDVVCVFGGTDAALRMRAAMGFRPRNEAQIWVKPLRPLRQALTHQTRNWKSAARLARNWMWSREPAKERSQWTAAPIRVEGVPFPQSDGQRFVFEQAPEQIRYLLQCPTARFEYFTVRRAGEPVGYFCLVFVPGQARLAESWLQTDEPDACGQLLRLARQQALANPNSNEMVAQTSSASMQAALRDAGFRLYHSDSVLVYDPKRSMPETAILDFQMIHGDMAFWHRGRPLYLS